MTIREILDLDDFALIQQGFDAALQKADDAQAAFGQAVARMELTQAANDQATREASQARNRAFAARDEFQKWVAAVTIIKERLDLITELEKN